MQPDPADGNAPPSADSTPSASSRPRFRLHVRVTATMCGLALLPGLSWLAFRSLRGLEHVSDCYAKAYAEVEGVRREGHQLATTLVEVQDDIALPRSEIKASDLEGLKSRERRTQVLLIRNRGRLAHLESQLSNCFVAHPRLAPFVTSRRYLGALLIGAANALLFIAALPIIVVFGIVAYLASVCVLKDPQKVWESWKSNQAGAPAGASLLGQATSVMTQSPLATMAVGALVISGSTVYGVQREDRLIAERMEATSTLIATRDTAREFAPSQRPETLVIVPDTGSLSDLRADITQIVHVMRSRPTVNVDTTELTSALERLRGQIADDALAQRTRLERLETIGEKLEDTAKKQLTEQQAASSALAKDLPKLRELTGFRATLAQARWLACHLDDLTQTQDNRNLFERFHRWTFGGGRLTVDCDRLLGPPPQPPKAQEAGEVEAGTTGR